VALAQAVDRTNDRRAAIKRAVNELTGSTLVEVKSYDGADGAPAPDAPPVGVWRPRGLCARLEALTGSCPTLR
jgi:hypothetical protein